MAWHGMAWHGTGDLLACLLAAVEDKNTTSTFAVFRIDDMQPALSLSVCVYVYACMNEGTQYYIMLCVTRLLCIHDICTYLAPTISIMSLWMFVRQLPT